LRANAPLGAVPHRHTTIAEHIAERHTGRFTSAWDAGQDDERRAAKIGPVNDRGLGRGES